MKCNSNKMKGHQSVCVPKSEKINQNQILYAKVGLISKGFYSSLHLAGTVHNFHIALAYKFKFWQQINLQEVIFLLKLMP